MKWMLGIAVFSLAMPAFAKREPPPLVLGGGLTLSLSTWEAGGVDPRSFIYTLHLELWVDPAGPARLTASGTSEARASVGTPGSLHDAGGIPPRPELFRLVGHTVPAGPDTLLVRFDPTTFSPRNVVWRCDRLRERPSFAYRCAVPGASVARSKSDTTPSWLYYPSVLTSDGSLHAFTHVTPLLTRMPEPEIRNEIRP